jgi:periplasmic copper chaperone A
VLTPIRKLLPFGANRQGQNFALATLVLMLLTALAGCSPAPKIEVSDAWVRSSDSSVVGGMTGAFMQITNNSDADVTLVGAEIAEAGMVEIHETVMVDGAMRMQEISSGLVIPAGSISILEPGGNHVMLMMLKQDIAAGQNLDITLMFSDGTELTVTATAKPSQAGDEEYHENEDMTDMEMENG